MLLPEGLGHLAEEDVTVGHGERVGKFEIEFKLRIAVLVVEGINVPSERIHGRNHVIQPVKHVEKPLDIVATLVEVVVGIGHDQPPALVLL